MKRPRFSRVAFVLMAFFMVAVQGQAQGKTVWARDLVYYADRQNVLRLDIARPADDQGPFPAVIFLATPASSARSTYEPQLAGAAARGYAGITLDYHDIEIEDHGKARYPFPNQILDVKRAIRWLRQNADKYQIDPTEIGVIGWSYGGYLALMAGLTGDQDGFEPAGTGPDTKVQAVVSLAGFIDWTKMDESEASWSLGGTSQDIPDVYTKANPLTYVRQDDPPMLLLYGKQDPVAPSDDAALLDQKLAEAGGQHSLYVINEADHLGMSGYVDKGIVWGFFDGVLKKKAN
ncbi:MAG TPA: prolyl oligopeptidase family serine peptidase [Spirochaetia bacterium]|nr:prolyl oligopeptidase family serine peptidase [Spirochaetia bacterium]